MVQTLVIGSAVVLVVLVGLVRLLRGGSKSDAQRERDRAHERAQKRPPEEAAEIGETYSLVVRETQYDRTPAEIRGTINGLQTFVREIPDPDGRDALAEGDTIRVQVADYGTNGTSAQARFLERV